MPADPLDVAMTAAALRRLREDRVRVQAQWVDEVISEVARESRRRARRTRGAVAVCVAGTAGAVGAAVVGLRVRRGRAA